MSELQLIKKRIYDEQRIEELLELLECTSINTEQRGGLYVAALPDGENARSVQVKNNENLSSSIRSRKINGDIYTIVSYIVYGAETQNDISETLPKSKFWICSKLGYLEYIDDFFKETSDGASTQIKDFNKWMRKLFPKKIMETTPNTPIDKKVLNRYGIMPYLEWWKEGIGYRTQREFGVGIDVQSERVTFPIHDRKGNLIGVKGRYCGNDNEIEGKYKYLYIIPCNKSIEFYNFHRAIPYIKETKQVYIVEGAKTVMKLHEWGYKNAISIEGDSLSDAQIALLKELDLSTKLIFAWDKDKDINHVKQELARVNGRRKYAIMDTKNLLEMKSSPVDAGKDVWETLLERCLYKVA